MVKNLIYLSCFSLLIIACNHSSSSNSEELEKVAGDVSPVAVSVYTLNKSDFKQQLLSNGKIIATQQAILRFQTSALLKTLSIKNGQEVSKGDTLAILENGQNSINLQQAENAIINAKLNLLDELLLAGYKSIEDTANVPNNALEQYKIRSGFNQAKLNNEKALFEYGHTFLIAPFSGVIANLDKQVFNLINANEEFCTLYDDQNLAIDFKLMEMEIKNIYRGQKIKLNPFNNPELELLASISEINPMVDENGLIKIKAKIKPTKSKQLFIGLNIKVVIEHSVPMQFIIPKEAMVLRSNRNVIFHYQDGLAKWVYINILHENESYYAISGDIKEGDKVIVSNNLNLAHDAKVTLVENKE